MPFEIEPMRARRAARPRHCHARQTGLTPAITGAAIASSSVSPEPDDWFTASSREAPKIPPIAAMLEQSMKYDAETGIARAAEMVELVLEASGAEAGRVLGVGIGLPGRCIAAASWLLRDPAGLRRPARGRAHGRTAASGWTHAGSARSPARPPPGDGREPRVGQSKARPKFA